MSRPFIIRAKSLYPYLALTTEKELVFFFVQYLEKLTLLIGFDDSSLLGSMFQFLGYTHTFFLSSVET